MGRVEYVRSLLRKYGAVGLIIKYIEKRENPIDKRYRADYRKWMASEEELCAQRSLVKTWENQPLISIVVPTYRTDARMLDEMIASVVSQTYEKWELLLVDGSGMPYANDIENAAKKFADSRIRYIRLEENLGISENTNVGIADAKGEYIALLDHDDLLAPNALYEMVSAVQERGHQPLMVYSDEDKITEDGELHFEPHFKPDYNEELLNNYNYICHFLMVHRSVIEKVGALNKVYDGAQDYDFVLRSTEVIPADRIAHVAKIVYHWRVSQSSTAGFSGNKDYAKIAAEKAVAEHKKRIESQSGKYIVSLGKSISCVEQGWDEQLAEAAKNHKTPVGLIGGRILDSRGRHVESIGYRYSESGLVEPNFQGLASFKKGYFQRAYYPQQVSAVSLDFCVIDIDAFEKVGGFDETLSSPYREMDFCLRLKQAGYAVLVQPQVTARRGKACNCIDAEASRDIFIQRWNDELVGGDPFIHENIRCNGYV